MKVIPIPFNTHMVRATLDGRKYMTRRMVMPQPEIIAENPRTKDMWFVDQDGNALECPYGRPGDVLYVQEKYSVFKQAGGTLQREKTKYKADPVWDDNESVKWAGVESMPQDAARIWLRIDQVRVERLQDISESDALREGIECSRPYIGAPTKEVYKVYGNDCDTTNEATFSFATLWEEIHGVGSWKSNPWVWVIWFNPISLDGNFNGQWLPRVIDDQKQWSPALRVVLERPMTWKYPTNPALDLDGRDFKTVHALAEESKDRTIQKLRDLGRELRANKALSGGIGQIKYVPVADFDSLKDAKIFVTEKTTGDVREAFNASDEDDTITAEDLANPDNLVYCEGCSSAAHKDQAFMDPEHGGYSCPKCHQAWLEQQIEIWRKLAWTGVKRESDLIRTKAYVGQRAFENEIAVAFARALGMEYGDFHDTPMYEAVTQAPEDWKGWPGRPKNKEAQS